jgi:hypothetical protein
MRMITLASASAAVVVALTLFDMAPVEAAVQRRAVTVRKVQRAPSRARPRVHHAQPRVLHKKMGTTRSVTKGVGSGSGSSLVKKGTLDTGTQSLRGLPLHQATAGTAFLRGRVAVPQNLRPKFTITRVPGAAFRPRLAPFVQRHWKKAFFWVAIAGIGYLTIPELYYDRFYTCVSVDDPIYDDCIDVLSYAVLEEEEVVRISMPATAVYRYRAKAEVRQDCPSCRWQRFVDRRWNQSYGWVKLPQVGNVTVPDAYYDRFYTFAGANPPNYPQACQVLQDAAAVKDESEVVRISMPPGAEYRYRAEVAPTQECKSCTLEPFVERKWNRQFVWVQIPQTGNVTVPEDSYDRFYRYAGAEPPNYPAACKVLVEAVASDTVMTTSLDTRRLAD